MWDKCTDMSKTWYPWLDKNVSYRLVNDPCIQNPCIWFIAMLHHDGLYVAIQAKMARRVLKSIASNMEKRGQNYWNKRMKNVPINAEKTILQLIIFRDFNFLLYWWPCLSCSVTFVDSLYMKLWFWYLIFIVPSANSNCVRHNFLNQWNSGGYEYCNVIHVTKCTK